MEIDERGIAISATIFAVIGIALLLFLSETPAKATVAQALIAPQNSLLLLRGTVANVTADKFSLCEGALCISVKKKSSPSANLVRNGAEASILGRVKEYMGQRYFEAEQADVE
ncbi:MAG: hypothetical protein NT051_04225 [Candidatus Micrarchaeota archaeon]|nr:hypothetical protein [Candidatus Micrarchaeota archaeon]